MDSGIISIIIPLCQHNKGMGACFPITNSCSCCQMRYHPNNYTMKIFKTPDILFASYTLSFNQISLLIRLIFKFSNLSSFIPIRLVFGLGTRRTDGYKQGFSSSIIFHFLTDIVKMYSITPSQPLFFPLHSRRKANKKESIYEKCSHSILIHVYLQFL